MKREVKTVVGADGIPRRPEEEQRLNELFEAKFGDSAGRQVLEYLASISIERVHDGSVSTSEVMHQEGKRWLYGVIKNRAAHKRVAATD